MDIVDQVVYDWEFDGFLPEATRQAFVNLFDPQSEDARLVIKYLVGVTHWGDTYQCNDETFNSQILALKGVMEGIKKQLNMKPITIQEIDDE